MSSVLEEMKAILDGDQDALMHYGMPRRSGRYPWGSGEDPYQHSEDFLGRIDKLKAKGWEETPENVMKEFGLTTTQYRAQKGLAKDYRRMLDVSKAEALQKKGLGTSAIGREMGISESTVRSLLDPIAKGRMLEAKNTADAIRKAIDEKGMIDIGTGVEHELGVSKEKFNQALAILESEGYPIYKGGVPQVTNRGQQINQKVICPPGTAHKDIYNYDQVHTLTEYHSNDGGDTFDKYEYPAKLDSNRVKILLKDEKGPDGETGEMKDGLIMIRRGLKDITLGDSRYSQVRILMDDKKYGKEGYMKGMAVYSDNLPDGVDVLWNTNKPNYEKAIKNIDTKDPMNPFGSTITAAGQSHYIDEKTGERKLGYINKRADEGDWSDWADTVPAQFLSKQSKMMAKKQLALTIADKKDEYDEIMSLTNPTIKKHFLSKFADECDAAAVDLKAAALPGQQYHVIIPLNTLKDTEVYAPNYKNGTKLALVRYPHEGTFEIPILTVNNNHQPARKLLGTDVGDAICITKKVADRLSGADFDGDTVMCIPTHDPAGKVKVTSTPELAGLKDFDTRMSYPAVPGMKVLTKKNTGREMGMISNLITDMTLGGASDDELAAATRHAMVVIDAAKHHLNYKKSEIDNGIAGLREKYQRRVLPDGSIKVGGASTIISRAGGQASVEKRQGTPKTNMKLLKNGQPNPDYDPTRPEGALIYKKADDLVWTDKKGKEHTRMQKSTQMLETDDAMTLVSEHKWPMEIIYAEHANKLKAMANEARKQEYVTGKIEYSASAKKIYSSEVSSLMAKLNTAKLNAPKERAAQRRANVEVDALTKKAEASGAEMSKEDIKKASQRSLVANRSEVGSVSRRDRSIKITDREWEAIQAGAITESKLIQILNNADTTELRQRATPRATTAVSGAKIARIKALAGSNYTLEQIATKTGLSVTTISKYLKGEN